MSRWALVHVDLDHYTKCLSEEPAKHASPEQLAQLAPFATPKDERRFEIIKFLHSKRSAGCTAAAMDAAASNGNLPLLKWLHSNMRARCTRQAMDDAAARGRLDIVKWIHQNRKGCTTAAMDWAAAGGHLEVVKWLHQNRREGCTTMAMDQAAASGELEMVQWLCANRSEGCTSDAIEAAACAGDLKMVKLLHKTNPECIVVEGGDDGYMMDILDQMGVSLTHATERIAALAEGKVLLQAAAHGYSNVVQWIVSNGTVGHEIIRAMSDAVIHGHFELLLYLRSQIGEDCSPSALKTAWDHIRYWQTHRAGISSEPNELISWFEENYQYPTSAEIEQDIARTMQGMDAQFQADFNARFEHVFFR